MAQEVGPRGDYRMGGDPVPEMSPGNLRDRIVPSEGACQRSSENVIRRAALESVRKSYVERMIPHGEIAKTLIPLAPVTEKAISDFLKGNFRIYDWVEKIDSIRGKCFGSNAMSLDEAQGHLHSIVDTIVYLRGELQEFPEAPGYFRVVFFEKDILMYMSVSSFWGKLRNLTQGLRYNSCPEEDIMIHRFNDIICPIETIADKKGRLHANVVKFSGVDQEYIITQAPVEATVGDFWRVAYDQDVGVVVDLTTQEDTLIRRIPSYAPVGDGEKMSLPEGYVVKYLGSCEFPTSFMVKYPLRITHERESHDLSRIRYGWTDFSGAATNDVIKLIEQIEMHASGKPVMCHCTAGVGRSGTLAVCRAVYEGIRREIITNEIQLKECVARWVIEGRIQRGPAFVQQKVQLKTIFDVGEELLRRQG